MDYRRALIDAYKIARNSEDPSTQVGVVLLDQNDTVLSDGWNEFPHGVAPRWERPAKYDYIEHAERNAIFCAARLGVGTVGATMVCTWGPCISCARAIIQAGVVRFITHHDCVLFGMQHGLNWNDLSVAQSMLIEAGIEVIDYEGRMHASLSIRHSGYIFKP